MCGGGRHFLPATHNSVPAFMILLGFTGDLLFMVVTRVIISALSSGVLSWVK